MKRFLLILIVILAPAAGSAEMDGQLFPTVMAGAHTCGILSAAAVRCEVTWPEPASREGMLSRARAKGANAPQLDALGAAWDRGAEFGNVSTPCTPRERKAAEEARQTCAAVLGN